MCITFKLCGNISVKCLKQLKEIWFFSNEGGPQEIRVIIQQSKIIWMTYRTNNGRSPQVTMNNIKKRHSKRNRFIKWQTNVFSKNTRLTKLLFIKLLQEMNLIFLREWKTLVPGCTKRSCHKVIDKLQMTIEMCARMCSWVGRAPRNCHISWLVSP